MKVEIRIREDATVEVTSSLPPPPSRPSFETDGLTPDELQELALVAEALHNIQGREWLIEAIRQGHNVRLIRAGNRFNVYESVDPAAPEWQHVPEHLRGWLGSVHKDRYCGLVFHPTRPEWRARSLA